MGNKFLSTHHLFILIEGTWIGEGRGGYRRATLKGTRKATRSAYESPSGWHNESD